MGRTRMSFATALSAAAAAASWQAAGRWSPRCRLTVGTDAPKAAAGEVQTGELVAGLNEFGLDFLRLLTEGSPDENVVFSPLSIGMAFGMAEAGARGETADQIAEVFGFPSSAKGLHRAFGAARPEALRLGQVDGAAREPDVPADRLSARRRVRADARGRVQRSARAARLPGRSGRFQAADQRLGRRAHRGSDQGVARRRTSSTPTTVLVLVNALYLEAKWSQPFGKEATAPAPFTRLDGIDRRRASHAQPGAPHPLPRFPGPPGGRDSLWRGRALDAGPRTRGRHVRQVRARARRRGASGDRRADAAKGSSISALPRWKSDFKVDLLQR